MFEKFSIVIFDEFVAFFGRLVIDTALQRHEQAQLIRVSTFVIVVRDTKSTLLMVLVGFGCYSSAYDDILPFEMRAFVNAGIF